jgi:hypothetical protein
MCVAGRTIVAGDLRALSVTQFEHAKEVMTAIVKDSLPRASATTFDDAYPPLAPTLGTSGCS